jgi:hypothetical protein
MGASRVFLGVHWPTDILAAWLYAEGWLRLAELIGVGARDGTSVRAGTAGPTLISRPARLREERLG